MERLPSRAFDRAPFAGAIIAEGPPSRESAGSPSGRTRRPRCIWREWMRDPPEGSRLLMRPLGVVAGLGTVRKGRS